MSLIEWIFLIIIIGLGVIYTMTVNKAKKESHYCCGKGCAGCKTFEDNHKSI